MTTDNFSDTQSQLKMALKELERNAPQDALKRLTELKAQNQNISDIEHLIALSHKAMGNFSESEEHFKQCLEIDPQQPEAHNNLANLFKSQSEFDQAEQHYKLALSFHSKYFQAQRNLAICYQSQENYIGAIAAYKKALELSPNDLSALCGMADCMRLTGDLITAEKTYNMAIALDSNSFKAWHNLGLNFYVQKKLAEAIVCYQNAYDIAPNMPELTESLAFSRYESGDVLTSVELFKSALSSHPANVNLHENLNKMLWETEYKGQFGDSYAKALAHLGSNYDVAISYASMMFKAGEIEQAKNIISSSGLSLTENYEVLSIQGQINAELGNYDLAYDFLRKSLHQKFSKDIALQMVKIDIILARYTQAQDLLTDIFLTFPDCQLTWALQSLVWRFTDHERYNWLCDYEEFIQVYQLDVPENFTSLVSFLSSIRSELDQLHLNENAPLQQTLRNGTQTTGSLLDLPTQAIQSLKISLDNIVSSYIESLPQDKSHPFLGRKSSDYEFSGSWSVKLRPNGFHINHVHPQGWISSSCYITIPESMKISDPNDPYALNMGYIKFGESPLQLAEREKVERNIKPELGMVVLFPSYFWHGTYPFDGSVTDFRLTTPFDVIPV